MSKLTRWHPFTPLLPHSRNLLLREFFDGPRASAWTPQVDVVETPSAYLIKAEIPGLDPAEIEITLKDKALTLKGEKTRAAVRDEDELHISERSHGAFQRVFTFREPVDAESISAESSDGLLEITVNKAPEAQPQRIEIKTTD